VHHEKVVYASTPAHASVQVILWEDIFVVVDDGKARPHEYVTLRQLITAQAKRFPSGLGCLAIIPQNARPPSEDSRKALNAGLEGLAGALRCICWLVEGSGFQGAMVRAVLTGLRFVALRSYATHVSTNMDEAIAWMLTHLANPDDRGSDVVTAREEIMRRRHDVPRADGFAGSP
jgi:hypothetical protein